MKHAIEESLARIIDKIGVSDVFPHVECPDDPKNGDFTTNVAMILSKRLKAPPIKIAEQLKDIIIHDQTLAKNGWFERVEAVPPGFVNFYMSQTVFVNELTKVLNNKERYGMDGKSPQRPINVITGTPMEDREQGKGKQGGMHSDFDTKTGQDGASISRDNSARAEKKDKNNFTDAVKSEIDSREHDKRKVMIEFTDPNPFKEFHIGHLRNISLGESYCRLVESTGDEVRRANYQGDIGMHVAKALWGLMRNSKLKAQIPNIQTPKEKAQLLGQAYAAGAKAFEEDEHAKQEIIDVNKKVYVQDPTVVDLWKQGRQWSLDYFDTIYARLGTKFTRFYFESEVAPIGMQLVMDHVKDGVFEESDGAIIFRGENVGLHTRVFVSKEKYATYEAKDLALAPLKYSEYPYDLSIIMTGNEQYPYFSVMLAALQKINPDLAAKTRHMPFGMVNLKTGKMSSRTGNVITANQLIDLAKEKIYAILDKNTVSYTQEQRDQIAEIAAIGAVKYSMLKVGATSDIAFDLDASVAFDGDSGPYLQYTYARCKSVLRKAGGFASPFILHPSPLNPEERLVMRLIMQFPFVVSDAAANFTPNTVCTYLFHLAQQFNVFYTKHTIMGNDFRLALTAATAQVLKNGLYLLGIDVLEQM